MVSESLPNKPRHAFSWKQAEEDAKKHLKRKIRSLKDHGELQNARKVERRLERIEKDER